MAIGNGINILDSSIADLSFRAETEGAEATEGRSREIPTVRPLAMPIRGVLPKLHALHFAGALGRQ